MRRTCLEVDPVQGLERRFPGRARTIRRRVRDDASFKELCADYAAASAALEHWQSPPQRSEAKAKEYRDLLAELEAEIAAALDD